jgi:hypothetical protein
MLNIHLYDPSPQVQAQFEAPPITKQGTLKVTAAAAGYGAGQPGRRRATTLRWSELGSTTLPAKGCEGIEGFFCNRCLYGGMVRHTSL